MRRRGNHIKSEHVLIGLLAAVVLIVGLLFRNSEKYNVDEVEDVPYGAMNIGNLNEAPVENIGPQWSATKQAQVNQLNQKMYHDLELTPIE